MDCNTTFNSIYDESSLVYKSEGYEIRRLKKNDQFIKVLGYNPANDYEAESFNALSDLPWTLGCNQREFYYDDSFLVKEMFIMDTFSGSVTLADYIRGDSMSREIRDLFLQLLVMIVSAHTEHHVVYFDLNPYTILVREVVSRDITFIISGKATTMKSRFDIRFISNEPFYRRGLNTRVVALTDDQLIRGIVPCHADVAMSISRLYCTFKSLLFVDPPMPRTEAILVASGFCLDGSFDELGYTYNKKIKEELASSKVAFGGVYPLTGTACSLAVQFSKGEAKLATTIGRIAMKAKVARPSTHIRLYNVMLQELREILYKEIHEEYFPETPYEPLF